MQLYFAEVVNVCFALAELNGFKSVLVHNVTSEICFIGSFYPFDYIIPHAKLPVKYALYCVIVTFG